jgi:V/A-type H+-transporting ATPase subunit D
MALKFQYNKIALQGLNRQLNIRLNALPILKNKEMVLRLEVAKARRKIGELNAEIRRQTDINTREPAIWCEFLPELLSLGEVVASVKKIAGIQTPVLEQVHFKEAEFSLFSNPQWFPEGISILKRIVTVVIERDFYIRKMELLNQARRKTTQKVNLYEKVQVPAYEEAIRKIKRFLEDEETLSKSAQKILKTRQQFSVTSL